MSSLSTVSSDHNMYANYNQSPVFLSSNMVVPVPESKPKANLGAKPCFCGLGVFQCISTLALLVLAITSLAFWDVDLPPPLSFHALSVARGLTHGFVTVLSVIGIIASGLCMGMARSKKAISTCMLLSYLTLTMIETIGFFVLFGGSIYVATEVHESVYKIQNAMQDRHRSNDYGSIYHRNHFNNNAVIIDVVLVIMMIAHVICAIISMALTCYNISRKSKILPTQASPQHELVQPPPHRIAHMYPTVPPPPTNPAIVSGSTQQTGQPVYPVMYWQNQQHQVEPNNKEN